MKKALKPIAILALIAALFYGWIRSENRTFQFLSDYYKTCTLEKLGSNPEGYRVTEDGKTAYYIYPGRTTGWGGPMTVAPVMTPELTLKEVLVTEHRETPVFFDYLVSNHFFAQFAGKTPQEAVRVGKNIDAVSGATISSKAITRAVRSGMEIAAHELAGTAIATHTVTWSVGKDEILLLALYAAVLGCTLFKLRKARLPMLVLSFLFLGLLMKRPVSVSNIAALLMGHAPSAGEDLFWWLLVPGSLALVACLGKNVYCTWLCPFGALQELITRTGGLKVSVPKQHQAGLKAAAKAITWLALMVAFATGNAAHAAIEPFATLFGLKGTAVQWYLVSLALIGAFFIPRFWCRFFCPAGVCFSTAAGVRRSINRGIHRLPGSEEAAREKPED